MKQFANDIAIAAAEKWFKDFEPSGDIPGKYTLQAIILTAIDEALESPDNMAVIAEAFQRGVRAGRFEAKCVPIESLPQKIQEKIQKAGQEIESRIAASQSTSGKALSASE